MASFRKNVAKLRIIATKRPMRYYKASMAVTTTPITQHLRHHGYSITAPRLAVLRVLQQADEPLKRAHIAERATAAPPAASSQPAAATPRCNRASVYRALQVFERIGITTVHMRGWTPYISLAEPFQPHHHHITCTMCGAHQDVATPELEAALQAAARSHGYSLGQHSVALSGMCPRCQHRASTRTHTRGHAHGAGGSSPR